MFSRVSQDPISIDSEGAGGRSRDIADEAKWMLPAYRVWSFQVALLFFLAGR
jgi:hypothetical protein